MTDDDTPPSAGAADRPAGHVSAVLSALPDGALVERDGFVLFVNPPALRTLGYSSDAELFWRPTEELIHPSERGPLRQRLRSLADAAPAAFELRMLRRTGQIVPVEARLLAINFEGAPAALILLHDLSERRRMERQLQFADRMASVGTLAAGVAHEINNPLTYVLANMEMMAEAVTDPAAFRDAEVRDELIALLDEARDGAMRVQTIVRELKSFARKPSEHEVGSVELRRLVESVSRMARSEIKHRARLVVELGDTPPVRANPQQLHQVLLNLVVNAAQAIELGDVAGNHVRITTGLDASGHVLIEVADTGCGIEPAALERLFDPFFTTKDPGEGSGLGLWICHGVVTSLGGTITADSIVGRGTTFRLTLPAAG